jgi:hypothetical protein
MKIQEEGDRQTQRKKRRSRRLREKQPSGRY